MLPTAGLESTRLKTWLMHDCIVCEAVVGSANALVVDTP